MARDRAQWREKASRECLKSASKWISKIILRVHSIKMERTVGNIRRKRADPDGALLIITRLDRLGRSVHFISGLMERKVPFLAVEFPEATPMMLHIHAAMAEHERKLISQRTKEGLERAKARGVKLGSYGQGGVPLSDWFKAELVLNKRRLSGGLGRGSPASCRPCATSVQGRTTGVIMLPNEREQ